MTSQIPIPGGSMSAEQQFYLHKNKAFHPPTIRGSRGLMLLAIALLLTLNVGIGVSLSRNLPITAFSLANILVFVSGGLLLVLWAFALRPHVFKLFLLFLFLIPWEGAVQIGPGQTIMPLLGAYLAFVWLLGVHQGSYQVVWTREFWLMAAFWLLILLASFLSSEPSMELEVILSYFQLIVLVVLATSLITNYERLKTSLLTLTMSATFSSLYAIFTFCFFGDNYVGGQELMRATGSLSSVSRLTFVAGMATLLLVTYWWHTHRARLLIILGVLINLAAVNAGASLTVAAGFVIGLGVWLIMKYRDHIRLNLLGIPRVMLLAILLLGLSQIPAVKQSIIIQHVEGKWQQVQTASISRWGSGRGATWISTMAVIRDHPWLGVGERQLAYLVRSPLYWIDPHLFRDQSVVGSMNTFLAVAGSAGIFALVFFLAFIVVAFVRLYRTVVYVGQKQEIDRELVWIGGSLLAWWIMTVVTLLGLDYQRLKFLWLLVALSVSYSLITRHELSAQIQAEEVKA